MSSWLRLLGVLVAVLVLAAACSQAVLPGSDDDSDADASSGPAEGTCWSAARVGADPQEVLKISDQYDVPYLTAARALADRPSFSRRADCDEDHAIEVYRVVALPKLEKELTDYATLLKIQEPVFATISRSLAKACMTGPLAEATAKTELPGAVMSPELPEEAALGWAPASPEQWSSGHRVFACTLTWSDPQPTRYATVFTKGFPTGLRTCIDSRALVFVDCARRHDRERIAVIEAREAVAAGAFPGPKAIRKGPSGRYLAVGDAHWRRLDAACTAYLRTVSTTKKLSGIANVDVDEWPAPGGSYPIYCDADTRPHQKSLVTEGSVYDRG